MLVRVVGFSDEERHALNTLLRLSEERDTRYALWAPGGAAAELALVDGDSFEASHELATGPNTVEKLIWVGADAPANAAFTFQRPIQWPLVLDAVDTLFAQATTVDIDFDLDFDAPAAEPAEPAVPAKRALIVDTDLERRFYWRAKLVLADWYFLDEAPNGEIAKMLITDHDYAMVIVDFQLPDADPWQVVRMARAKKAPTIITVRDRSMGVRLRARREACVDCLKVPLVPSQVYYAIRKV